VLFFGVVSILVSIQEAAVKQRANYVCGTINLNLESSEARI